MSSAWRTAEEGDLDEDIDTLLEQKQAGEVSRDSILFLIDTSAAMFVPGADGEIPWVSAIKCASATMKNKIISSEDDLIGVLLYNTRLDRNMANFRGIYQLQKLDVADAERIRELDGLAKSFDDFVGKVGSASGVDEEAIMGNVFWSCSSIFGPLKRKAASKRVFLFTNQDSPHEENVSLQRAAKIRARDLSDLGIFIELFNLDRPGHKFDVSLFYTDVLPLPLDADDEAEIAAQSTDSSEKFAELMAKVRRRESRKRAQGKMNLTLGEDTALAIRIYTLYMEAKKGPYVWMDEGSGKLAEPVTEWIGQKSGATLKRQELQYYYDFGGEKAVFSKTELDTIKDLGQPGLRILGFRPSSWLKPHYNLTHSSFIFPDESAIRGSIQTFSALLKGMLELDQIAIGSFIARRTQVPKLVALVPQAEQNDPDTGVQVKPAGMNLIVLPFADDLRRLQHDGDLQPVDVQIVDKAKEIVAKLTIAGGFDPEAFENPSLQRHYTALQALALDQEPEEEDLRDTLLPDTARMQKRVGALCAEFAALIPADDPAPAKTAKKRSTATSDRVDLSDIKSIAGDAGKLAKMTVAALKAYAESIGIKPSRLKADIISQIVAASSDSA